VRAHDVVGVALVAGLVALLIGAGGWRLAYEQPLAEALRVIHADRRRRAWIHLWMIPAVFPPLDRWAGSLYAVHMASAYAASAVIGWAVLLAGELASWVGWLGIVGGLGFLAGFVATRFAGPFNPPFWAHTYTGALGVLLLLA
jgi:hypothetical protein